MSTAFINSSFHRGEFEDSGAPGSLGGPPELRDAQSWLRDALVARCYAGPTISSLITEAENGDSLAADQLFNSLYSELHRMARRELARRGSPASISATTLLHEAYLDIASREGSSFPDKPRFMGYAARVMRGLVIDHARSRNAIKRGGEFEITSLKTEPAQHCVDPRELSSISDALDQLAKVEPKLAELVDMKFFCGFSFAEIAALENLSERTVQRRWEKARIYLHRSLRADLPL
ncbi:MAG TPA: ECF-type sigma factor [Candidatus Baltobacteraceae bacterium]|nr:ECF-type sigma factor [Candidatus Baltobacteraceae bacterium]